MSRAGMLLLALGLPALASCDERSEPESVPDVQAPSAVIGAAPSLHYGWARAPAKPKGTVRLATYNVRNLFDGVDDPRLGGSADDMNSVKPESELRAVASAIRAIDADILCMQEVESKATLMWFADTYLGDMGYGHVASLDAGDGRGIEQSVLSRFSIVNVENWVGTELRGTQPARVDGRANPDAGDKLAFHRSPLRVDVKVPLPADGDARPRSEPYSITLFVVHFKAGSGFGYWRDAESAGTLELVKDVLRSNPDANIAVLGDFNATPNLPPARQIVTGGLIDLFADRTGEPKWVTHESGRAIDLILASGGLHEEIVLETRFVMGTPCREPGSDWRTTPAPEGFASDHFAVVVDIAVGADAR